MTLYKKSMRIASKEAFFTDRATMICPPKSWEKSLLFPTNKRPKLYYKIKPTKTGPIINSPSCKSKLSSKNSTYPLTLSTWTEILSILPANYHNAENKKLVMRISTRKKKRKISLSGRNSPVELRRIPRRKKLLLPWAIGFLLRFEKWGIMSKRYHKKALLLILRKWNLKRLISKESKLWFHCRWIKLPKKICWIFLETLNLW